MRVGAGGGVSVCVRGEREREENLFPVQGDGNTPGVRINSLTASESHRKVLQVFVQWTTDKLMSLGTKISINKSKYQLFRSKI